MRLNRKTLWAPLVFDLGPERAAAEEAAQPLPKILFPSRCVLLAAKSNRNSYSHQQYQDSKDNEATHHELTLTLQLHLDFIETPLQVFVLVLELRVHELKAGLVQPPDPVLFHLDLVQLVVGLGDIRPDLLHFFVEVLAQEVLDAAHL